MADEKEVKNKFAGIPCSEESLKEYYQTFKDMDENFKLLDKECENDVEE